MGSVNVLVEVEVRDDGSVGSTRTLTPQSGFDDSATSTARQWRFRPAQIDNDPVSSLVYMIVSYRQPQM
jgi:TonB family protein